MVALDKLNELRQQQDWEGLAQQAREYLKSEPDSVYVLRALVQALEKIDQKELEYESALIRLLELKDRMIETCGKLAAYHKEQGNSEEAVRYLEKAVHYAVDDRQYDALEDYWMQLVDLTPNHLKFFSEIAKKLNNLKQKPRAGLLLEMLLPVMEDLGAWDNRLALVNNILEYMPDDNNLREIAIDCFHQKYPDNQEVQRIIEHTGLNKERPLSEALPETELLVNFLPDTFVRHPDWGIGRVKELDRYKRRVRINFQRKRNHEMDIELAKNAVSKLADDDFRVLCVLDKERLKTMANEEPLELVKLLLRSFGDSLTTKEIKDNMLKVIENRHWNSWWSETQAALRKDPYISISGGANKQFTLREEAISDEDELLIKFDETKSAHAKVDQIYSYLRTTKKADVNEKVLSHFSKRIVELAPRRKSQAERVELFFTNEDLKNYSENLESMPQEILDEAVQETDNAVRVIQYLRFKGHQQMFSARLKALHENEWQDIYERLLLEPDIEVRTMLAVNLINAEEEQRIHNVVDTTLSNYRNYPRPFIWMAENALTGSRDWLTGKLQKPQILERLLLLVDNLTNQSKRRERDEALWLRRVAGDAREIIRRNNYAIFKESMQEADEGIAQSIYRRSQTNEGLDARTSGDLTTIIRARFPNLFQQVTEEAAAGPEAWYCLPQSLDEKKTLLKRLIEIELPAAVHEIEVARGHGDLKENAEYHAAREKQKLLASQVSELQDALAIANAVDVNQIEPDQIKFGTQFKVTPVGSDTIEEYILLGPWESDPDNHVLSYQAPFSRYFMYKKAGEQVEVEMPTYTGRYDVVEINRISPERLTDILSRLEKRDQTLLQNTEDRSLISEEVLPTDRGLEDTSQEEPAGVGVTDTPSDN